MTQSNASSAAFTFGFPGNNTGDDRVDTQGDLVSQEQFYLLLKCTLALRFAICVVGILGNLLNIRTFLRIGLEDTVSIVFFNLAISDLLILSAASVQALSSVCALLEEDDFFDFRFPPLYVASFCVIFARSVGDVTIYLTTFLALQRCLCVVKPFHFKGMFTRYRTFVAVSVIWAFCLIGGAVHFSQYQVREILEPSTNSSLFILLQKSSFKHNAVFIRVVNGIVLNECCQAVVLISLFFMVRALKTTVRFRLSNSHSQSTSGSVAPSKDSQGVTDQKEAKADDKDASSKNEVGSSKERQAIVQVSLVSTIFLITNTPYMVFSLAGLLVPGLGPFQKYHNTFALIFYIQWAVENINSAVNVFVYYRYNTKFREACFSRRS